MDSGFLSLLSFSAVQIIFPGRTPIFWVCSSVQFSFLLQSGLRFSEFAQVFIFLFSFKVDSDFLSLLKGTFFLFFFKVDSDCLSLLKGTLSFLLQSGLRFSEFAQVFQGLENYTFRVDSDFLSLLRLI